MENDLVGMSDDGKFVWLKDNLNQAAVVARDNLDCDTNIGHYNYQPESNRTVKTVGT
jgi:hypothetical protein